MRGYLFVLLIDRRFDRTLLQIENQKYAEFEIEVGILEGISYVHHRTFQHQLLETEQLVGTVNFYIILFENFLNNEFKKAHGQSHKQRNDVILHKEVKVKFTYLLENNAGERVL